MFITVIRLKNIYASSQLSHTVLVLFPISCEIKNVCLQSADLIYYSNYKNQKNCSLTCPEAKILHI